MYWSLILINLDSFYKIRVQQSKVSYQQMEPTKESSIESVKLNYIECPKPGLHYGEVSNMVCIEPSCLEDLICCCVCIEESHKKHITKPLKMIMAQAKQVSELIKPTNFNIDVILDIMSTSQKATIETFQNYKKQIMANLDEIEKSLIGYYSSICEQIKLKNTNPKAEVSAAFDEISNSKSTEDLKVWVKKLVAMIPAESKEPETTQVTEEQLIDSLNNCNQEINTMISNNVLEVNKKLKQYQKALEESVNKTNVWKKSPKFKFSSTMKHNDIKLINDFQIKSQNNAGYKFAIMEPSLEKGSDGKTFHFRIKECNSNWIAVGVCHKNIVVSKSYQFNFSSLGHGGYMISANGGTWSNNNIEFNNKVKAFKFAKGDVITAVVSMKDCKVTFKKKTQSFDVPFTIIPGDELHPCVLFYYVNDQVQYLPDYKP